jgi:hypothetical protein
MLALSVLLRNHHAGTAARFQQLDEVLQEQIRRFAGADREILLDLGPFFATERRIGNDHVVAVFLLHVGQVFGERVGVNDVGRFDAVQNEIH